MIDSHAHLTWHTYRGRVDEVVLRAREAGIHGIIDLGTDVSSSKRAQEHANEYENIWFTAGVHPSDAGEAERNDLDKIEELIVDKKCVAIGEIGLDYYRDYTDPVVQEQWFRAQLRLALKKNMPVVIHDRKASKRILEVLSDEEFDGINGPGGVFHCFAGDIDMMHEVLNRGFYISFTGNITYKKSDRPPVVKEVPIEKMLLETDSPFLAPVPRRGRENEPAYIPYIAAEVAKIKNISFEEVAKLTMKNSIKLFKLEMKNEGTI